MAELVHTRRALSATHRIVQKVQGFTLIEVLVALSALAVMAAMSWQSVDALLRSQTINEAAAEHTHVLHDTLHQWEADLGAMVQTGVVSGVDFDGRRMRITRRDPVAPGTGVRVVAWSIERRQDRSMLVRWQSPMLSSRAQLEGAWQQSAQSGSERPGEIQSITSAQWQIFYFRRNAWVNPLSANEQADAQALAAQAALVADAARRAAGGMLAPAPSASGPAAPSPAVNASLGLVPDGIRLQLDVQGSPGASGIVTKDWIRPQWTPGQG